jgi:hypothetical protein
MHEKIGLSCLGKCFINLYMTEDISGIEYFKILKFTHGIFFFQPRVIIIKIYDILNDKNHEIMDQTKVVMLNYNKP